MKKNYNELYMGQILDLDDLDGCRTLDQGFPMKNTRL